VHPRKTYDISAKDLCYAINAAIGITDTACNFKPIIHARHANLSHNSAIPRLSAKFPNERSDNSYRRPVRRIIPHDSLQFSITNRYSRKFILGVHFRRKMQIAVDVNYSIDDINCYLIDLCDAGFLLKFFYV